MNIFGINLLNFQGKSLIKLYSSQHLDLNSCWPQLLKGRQDVSFEFVPRKPQVSSKKKKKYRYWKQWSTNVQTIAPNKVRIQRVVLYPVSTFMYNILMFFILILITLIFYTCSQNKCISEMHKWFKAITYFSAILPFPFRHSVFIQNIILVKRPIFFPFLKVILKSINFSSFS